MKDEVTNLNKIDEVKYLSVENSYRYREIMRFFFTMYEQTEYWLYKEEVFENIKHNINDYSIEECERDLQFLIENKSLTYLQDTQNLNTLDDFKYHNFRYQLTDKAVIIERMTIELEEVEVKIASLEPRLFERINHSIKQFTNIYEQDEEKIYETWIDLNNDFKNLNQQYQDFLKKFHEAKTEELLKSDYFLEFKSNMINYINNFISSYLKNSTLIKNNLLNIDDDKVKYLMDKLISYQKKAPKISPEFDYDKLRKINYGKYISLKKWFINDSSLSEGERLLQATQNIISKLYKYANSLIELRGNMINRKEEYKYICHLFDKCGTLEEANTLSESIFGVIKSRHFKGNSMISTEDLVNSYSVIPIEIPINTTKRDYKIQSSKIIIDDKSNKKEKLLERKAQEEKIKKEKIAKLISSGSISLISQAEFDVVERRYILGLIEKYKGSETKETEFGYAYKIENIPGRCKIYSIDGTFELDNKKIMFLVGDDNE